MGARGFPPTPTAILKLRGGWRAKEREKQGEPQPETGRPLDPPLVDDADKKAWEQIVDQLERVPGLLTLIDGYQLERYARFLVRWRKIEADLQLFDGMTVATLRKDDTRQILRLLWAESRAMDLHLKQVEAQYGLTPAARSRIRLTGNLADVAKAEAGKGKGKSRFFKSG